MTTEDANKLRELIETKEAVVGVIGLGYVGLPLLLLFHEAGFRVVGIDTDTMKAKKLRSGTSYIRHIGAERVANAFRLGPRHAIARSDFEEIEACDVIIICVPTPLGEHREPDLSYVIETTKEIARFLRGGQLIILESTTYPGTTRQELFPILMEATPGDRGFFLAYSPEREDPGNKEFTTKNIPKLVGGIDEDSTALAVQLYEAVIEKVIPVSSCEIAESAKLFENIFRSVNIALANEMKVVFDKMGINVWEVIEAAKTKPFGFMPFYPGPGLGGHCIPLDPFYLTWKAAETGTWARFVELAGEINTSMPQYVVDRTMLALNTRKKSMNGASILVLGLSYKPDIDDDRESPSYEIMDLLAERGANVWYCDPFFPKTREGRRQGKIDDESVPCTPEEFAKHDAIIIATAHTAFKEKWLWENPDLLVIDTRNIVPGAIPA